MAEHSRSWRTRGGAPTDCRHPASYGHSTCQEVRLWLDIRLWEAFDPAKAGPESLLSWRKEIHLYQPDRVIEAITQAMSAVRERKRLGR
jgi:hypothetical protein